MLLQMTLVSNWSAIPSVLSVATVQSLKIYSALTFIENINK